MPSKYARIHSTISHWLLFFQSLCTHLNLWGNFICYKLLSPNENPPITIFLHPPLPQPFIKIFQPSACLLISFNTTLQLNPPKSVLRCIEHLSEQSAHQNQVLFTSAKLRINLILKLNLNSNVRLKSISRRYFITFYLLFHLQSILVSNTNCDTQLSHLVWRFWQGL